MEGDSEAKFGELARNFHRLLAGWFPSATFQAPIGSHPLENPCNSSDQPADRRNHYRKNLQCVGRASLHEFPERRLNPSHCRETQSLTIKKPCQQDRYRNQYPFHTVHYGE